MNREFLKKWLGDVSDDEKFNAAVDAIMAEHGKGVEREKAKSAKALEQAEADKAQLAELQEKVSSFDSVSGDRDAFKAELDALKVAQAEREAKAKADAERDAYYVELDNHTKEKTWLNDFARKAIFEEAIEMHKQSPTKGLTTCLDAITKDAEGNERPGVWANPQAPANIPPMGNTGINLSDDQRRAAQRQAMGLSVNTDGDK